MLLLLLTFSIILPQDSNIQHVEGSIFDNTEVRAAASISLI
jgi:hypothetical protein